MNQEAPARSVMLAVTDREFEQFRDLIQRESGILLKDTKRALLASRLARRLRELELETLSEYYDYLMDRDPQGEEFRRMINCVTTNKTSFFREEHHFRFVRERLIPQVRMRTAPGQRRQLRFWSAACSTGEEAYSLAITLRDAIESPAAWDIRILASDIDSEVLSAAEAGIYPADRLDGIPPDMARRHFLRGKEESLGYFRVKPELQRMITFRRINLMDEPWPIQGRFDAIFCRNVVIYFGRDTQRRLFERLIRQLGPDGYLFVGHSESLYWLTELAEAVQHTIYRPRIRGAH